MNDDTYPLAGTRVNRVGHGAMQLSGPGVFGPPRNRQHALKLLRYVVETGVSHLDTAYYYGLGVANELIHEALHPYPDDLGFLASISPTVHRLALAMSDRPARAIAIAETEEVAPEIAKRRGIALASVSQIIITEAGRRTREGQSQEQIADELRPAIEAVLDDLDRWLALATR
jgi:Aldo/keto reductase family